MQVPLNTSRMGPKTERPIQSSKASTPAKQLIAARITNIQQVAKQKSTPKSQTKQVVSARSVRLSAKARAAAAAAKVFHTVELLEAILSELPIRYLLLAQRVSRHWQQVIQDSSRLQQALFLKPIPVKALSILGVHRRYTASLEHGNQRTSKYKMLKNPLLAKIFNEVGSLEIEGYGLLESRIYKGYGRRARSLHKSWKEPTASWRRMLPTQPLVHSCFQLYVEDGTGQGYLSDAIDFDELSDGDDASSEDMESNVSEESGQDGGESEDDEHSDDWESYEEESEDEDALETPETDKQDIVSVEGFRIGDIILKIDQGLRQRAGNFGGISTMSTSMSPAVFSASPFLQHCGEIQDLIEHYKTSNDRSKTVNERPAPYQATDFHSKEEENGVIDKAWETASEHASESELDSESEESDDTEEDESDDSEEESDAE